MAEPDLHVNVADANLHELLAVQALVAWEDNGYLQHLGRLSEPGVDKDKLTLWMGCDGTKLLVNFHLPVKTRPSGNKTTKSMYLVVPIEQLRVTVDDVRPYEMPLATARQLQRDDVKQADVLARVHFSITAPAFVVMPIGSRVVERTLEGSPAQLMRNLKSLSAAREFLVYLNPSAKEKVQSVSATLREGNAETPALDLDTMYGRGCSGGKNAWEQYSCGESNASMLAWNPLVDDVPPPYEEITPPPPPRPSDPHNGETIGWATNPKPTQVFTDAPHIHAAARARARARATATSPRGTKRKPSEEAVPPPSANPGAFLGGSATDAESTPSDITATHHLADSVRLDALAQRALLRRKPNHPSPPLDWSLLAKPSLHIELQEFLVRAWTHDPTAHESLRPKMLALGAAIRDNDVATFDRLLGECQAAVLAQAGRGSPPWWEDADEVRQVENVREWLNREVCRNAGTLMFDMLVGLQGEAVAAKAAAREERGVRERFYAGKVKCLVVAFYVFGGRV